MKTPKIPKVPSAKIAQASGKPPKVKAPAVLKAAHSAKVTVKKPSAKVNGQKITKY
jgi:hypothetical protein